ncbi:MAG TPA: hypothetical protein VGU68_10090 [Ktedonobacteraceae bacterium]|nr:hypothetical protein [Ktedonobacteraceae bacterium]
MQLCQTLLVMSRPPCDRGAIDKPVAYDEPPSNPVLRVRARAAKTRSASPWSAGTARRRRNWMYILMPHIPAMLHFGTGASPGRPTFSPLSTCPG